MWARRWRWWWPRRWHKRSTRRNASASTTTSCRASTIPKTPCGRARPRFGVRWRTTLRSIPGSAIARRPMKRLRAPIASWPWTSTSIASPAYHLNRAPRWVSTTQEAGATRSMPAAAARCGRSASLPPCSASLRSSCASSPTTSAVISARATARSSSSAWCCGPRASSAVQSSSPPPAPRRSSATIRDATSSPGWSWRSPGTAASSPCARPTSAMWARAACRSRRFPRAPA